MPSSSSWTLSLKVLLISTAIVSVAVTLKLTVPLISTGLPAIWSVVTTWLRPPYLYVIINGIILTIAASTRFQHNQNQPQEFNASNASPPSDLTSELPPESNRTSFGVMELTPVSYSVESSVTVEPPMVYESEQSDVVGLNEDEFVSSGSTWNLSETVVNSAQKKKKEEEIEPEFDFVVEEKQPVTSRFAHNRKPAPEGARALRVLKPKKHETLETTWKMITDGRQLPLTRHLRKSDTFVDNLHHDRPLTAAKTKVVKKSETFKERTTYANQNDYPQPQSAHSAGGKLKKDGSLGQDELNRRVEAFIKKFNDDMRLQRQESLKQYMEMVKGGAR